MRYKLLGKSGLRVSELCLGTMTFGEDWGWGAGRDESRAIYDAFLEAGGNIIDTANVYTNGTSEKLLGEFMQENRERIVLATKYTNTMAAGDVNGSGNQRKSMMQAVEASLKRLKTDYIDLYWMHIWDQLTPVEEVRRFGAAGENSLRRNFRRARLVGRTREHACGISRLVAVRRFANRIQPDRAHTGTRAAADGESVGLDRHAVVTAVGRNFVGQIS